ncbi:hypothetical protein FDA09_00495 [Clostridium botulinum]|uniref:hypothetical protein n=1 Tax=Clostridium botulinum TaxID=1491 RepID=UPI0007743EC4|nr:hypothetical protein [Clostridium botulinum]NFH80211.1 hypothetical protein [Clostridium botulinum]NFH81896.1 hypothetical protein [Clostridium botulinum]NFI09870.1 hypothetical protein [Clostridium botulinum]NFI14929.1 hypothetical protein [Clostridium botulinum]NFO85012.1 hypothetical protein [Clostridium botulinum]
MIGFMCKYKTNNNEEYKKVIKARMNLMGLIFVIGSITVTASLMSKVIWKSSINPHIIDIYSGCGIGLVVASVIKWVQNKSILENEEKLKQSRLKNNDERILEINNKSLKLAGIVLLSSLYLVGLIGGFFYPILAQVLLTMVCVFFVTYFISYKIYDKKM